MLAGIRKDGVVEEGRQRGPLAAHRQITSPEVSDHRASESLRKPGGTADLEAAAVFGMMRNGLTVRGDACHGFEPDPRPSQQRLRRLGKGVGEHSIQPDLLPQDLRGRKLAGCQPMDLGLQRIGVGALEIGEQLEGSGVRAVGPLDQRRIDPIRRGARHQSHDPHAAESRPARARRLRKILERAFRERPSRPLDRVQVVDSQGESGILARPLAHRPGL